MTIAFITLFLLFNTFPQNLDYPRNAEDISKVELLRPDKSSNDKLAQIQELTPNETKQLLFILGKAKLLESKKFTPDYYIVFTTKSNTTKKVMINKNLVKGYDNDNVYEIRPLSLLLEF